MLHPESYYSTSSDIEKNKQYEPPEVTESEDDTCKAYLIALYQTDPLDDTEQDELVSGLKQQLGCPTLFLKSIQVPDSFPTSPDTFVIATAMLACEEAGIQFEDGRDTISFRGGEYRPGESMGIITVLTHSPVSKEYRQEETNHDISSANGTTADIKTANQKDYGGDQNPERTAIYNLLAGLVVLGPIAVSVLWIFFYTDSQLIKIVTGAIGFPLGSLWIVVLIVLIQEVLGMNLFMFIVGSVLFLISCFYSYQFSLMIINLAFIGDGSNEKWIIALLLFLLLLIPISGVIAGFLIIKKYHPYNRTSDNVQDIDAEKPVAASNSSENQIVAQQLSSDDQVDLAIDLLKSEDWTIRRDTATKVSELKMSKLGVVYELVNNLADNYKDVCEESAKALIALNSVGYAIRSLKDEYQYPSKMTSQEALKGVELLKKLHKNNTEWQTLYKENWENY